MNPIEFLIDIIGIPSLSGKEEDVAERVRNEFERLGYDEIIEAGGNVCGRAGSGGLVILYDAHMDVVEPGEGWQEDPFKARIKDGFISGRGSCDDKGSLAAMIYGGIKGRMEGVTLYVVGSVREEVAEGNGLREFFEMTGVKPDFVVIGEPSSLKIARGNRGRLGVRIDVKGRAAHASEPSGGINAIYRASEIIEKVKKLNKSLKEDSVAVTKIETHNKNINVIPEECSIYCDYRSGIGRKREDVLKKFSEFISEKDRLVTITPYYAPWGIKENHPVVLAASECMKEVLGKAEVVDWRFCTNGSYTAGELGIPTIGFGPGREEECHAGEEKIEIDAVQQAVDFYAKLPGFIHKYVVKNK